MKLTNLILIMMSLGPSNLAQFNAAAENATAATPPPGQSGEAGASYQVKLLTQATNNEAFRMGDVIQVGVFGALGTNITNKLKTDAPSVRGALKLYLNGIAIEGLLPVILQPDGSESSGVPTPKPVWVLQFELTRDASTDANRKAWDTLLPQLNYGKNEIQIGIGFNGEPPHMGEGRELKFQVAPLGLVCTVIAIGLVLYIALMWWALSTTMLRDGGAGTAYSLGKTQMAFWGLLVALTFLGVFVISHKMERIPEKLLILLGISGATGLGATLIGQSKRNAAGEQTTTLADDLAKFKAQQAELEAEKQSLEADKVAGGARWDAEKEKKLAALTESLKALMEKVTTQSAAVDAQKKEATHASTDGHWYTDITSDGNGLSFHRFQVVLWTVILGFVFIWTVCNTFSMPEFENTLLVLMGISNGTYLGFKIPEKQGD